MIKKLKYGDTKTYKYELDKKRLNWLTDKTNRSDAQTQFLFQLVDGDFEKLKEVEIQIKNCFYFACPSDKDELNKLMNMGKSSKYDDHLLANGTGVYPGLKEIALRYVDSMKSGMKNYSKELKKIRKSIEKNNK